MAGTDGEDLLVCTSTSTLDMYVYVHVHTVHVMVQPGSSLASRYVHVHCRIPGAVFFSNKNNTDTFFAELDGCDVAVSCATVAPWLHLFQQPSVHSVTDSRASVAKQITNHRAKAKYQLRQRHESKHVFLSGGVRSIKKSLHSPT